MAPELAAVTDAEVNVYLKLAVAAHATTGWGGVYQEALSFWAAHFLKTVGNVSGNAPTGSAGSLASQKDGDLSRGYNGVAVTAASAADQALALTSYGRAYLMLRNTRAATSAFAVSVSAT